MKLLRTSGFRRSSRGFTLIEIMIVVALMALVMAIGIPSFTRAMHKEGMRKAVSDVLEACGEARAQAILNNAPAELVIHPLEGTMQVERHAVVSVDGAAAPAGGNGGYSLKLPRDVLIELLGVNSIELQESDEARVKFFPNGTSDDFTLVLHSAQGEVRKISLEIVTGLADMEVIK